MFTPKELQLLDKVAIELFLQSEERFGNLDIAQHSYICYGRAQEFIEGRKIHFKEQKLLGIT